MADAIGPDERLELLKNKLCTIVTNDLFRNAKSGEQIAWDFDGQTRSGGTNQNHFRPLAVCINNH